MGSRTLAIVLMTLLTTSAFAATNSIRVTGLRAQTLFLALQQAGASVMDESITVSGIGCRVILPGPNNIEKNKYSICEVLDTEINRRGDVLSRTATRNLFTALRKSGLQLGPVVKDSFGASVMKLDVNEVSCKLQEELEEDSVSDPDLLVNYVCTLQK